MMPGGWDEVLRLPRSEVWPQLADAMRKHWPNAVCETGATSDELFFHRDRRALARWDAGTFDPSDDDMLHVVGGPESTTLVGGRRGGIATKVAQVLSAGRSRP